MLAKATRSPNGTAMPALPYLECPVRCAAGDPAFRLASTGVPATPPKTLVFSGTFKPDIRLSSVPHNRLEIIDNGADALIYDQPIGADGLRWRDMHRWWCDRHPSLDIDTAKGRLYQRLGQCLPGCGNRSPVGSRIPVSAVAAVRRGRRRYRSQRWPIARPMSTSHSNSRPSISAPPCVKSR